MSMSGPALDMTKFSCCLLSLLLEDSAQEAAVATSRAVLRTTTEQATSTARHTAHGVAHTLGDAVDEATSTVGHTADGVAYSTHDTTDSVTDTANGIANATDKAADKVSSSVTDTYNKKWWDEWLTSYETIKKTTSIALGHRSAAAESHQGGREEDRLELHLDSVESAPSDSIYSDDPCSPSRNSLFLALIAFVLSSRISGSQDCPHPPFIQHLPQLWICLINIQGSTVRRATL
ncbi:hypothetical protein PG995_008496 [Apiospora arundinis]|uniref:Uncharacterized protein n=1 Tax=Apiospora arundinis TaxID=335852 RepID=A0ABR2JNB5_9PEZI